MEDGWIVKKAVRRTKRLSPLIEFTPRSSKDPPLAKLTQVRIDNFLKPRAAKQDTVADILITSSAPLPCANASSDHLDENEDKINKPSDLSLEVIAADELVRHFVSSEEPNDGRHLLEEIRIEHELLDRKRKLPPTEIRILTTFHDASKDPMAVLEQSPESHNHPRQSLAYDIHGKPLLSPTQLASHLFLSDSDDIVALPSSLSYCSDLSLPSSPNFPSSPFVFESD